VTVAGDPVIEWLLDGDPSIRWQVMRDLLLVPSPEDWERERGLDSRRPGFRHAEQT
jgi:hypothetical protein